MAQRMKAFAAAKPEHLGLIPRTFMVQRTHSGKPYSDFYACTGICLCQTESAVAQEGHEFLLQPSLPLKGPSCPVAGIIDMHLECPVLFVFTWSSLGLALKNKHWFLSFLIPLMHQSISQTCSRRGNLGYLSLRKSCSPQRRKDTMTRTTVYVM